MDAEFPNFQYNNSIGELMENHMTSIPSSTGQNMINMWNDRVYRVIILNQNNFFPSNFGHKKSSLGNIPTSKKYNLDFVYRSNDHKHNYI